MMIEPSTTSTAFTLKVVEARKGLPYVAISHVWADGLGNVQHNALPSCQISRLYLLVRSILHNKRIGPWVRTDDTKQGSVAIWIDTLCIPRQQPFRTTAISLIHSVFVQAKYVLVLDSELQLLSWTVSIVEILVHVAVSGWMRRVWTLLEGSLGIKNLFVQCREASLSLKDCVANLQREWAAAPFQMSSLQMDARHFYWRLDLASRSYLDWGSRAHCHAFGHALSMFSGRTTSWEGDDVLCLGILMGLKPSEIARLYDTPVQSRMERLYSLLTYVPQGLLFCRGAQCGAEGLRWAPLDFRSARPYRQFRPARLYAGDGLEVVCPGFTLGAFPIPPNGFLFRETAKNRLWRVNYDMEPSADQLRAINYVPGQTELGIICPSADLARSGARDFDHIPAALVSIYKRANRTKHILDVGRVAIYCRFICVLVVSQPKLPEVNEWDTAHDPSVVQPVVAEAQRAPVFVGQHLRQRLRMSFLADAREEWLDQTWYVS